MFEEANEDLDSLKHIKEPADDELKWLRERIGEAYSAGLFKRLTQRERTCYFMMYHNGLSAIMISKTLNISRSSVKLYITRAIEKLRQMVHRKRWCGECMEYTPRYQEFGREACFKCDHYTENPNER